MNEYWKEDRKIIQIATTYSTTTVPHIVVLDNRGDVWFRTGCPYDGTQEWDKLPGLPKDKEK